ncbi:hypothetical protein ACFQMF_15220 [Halorubrum rutilum]|uniref:Uncharacterized protein n=1 Tax=Halorubrum rutilum TaxID=1364933 RepID=A0ABD6APE6_9EURY|nr:hypothetical protein [Halorubrum rutilum]
MNRRTFVTGTALAVPSGFAGCIEETFSTDDTRPDPGDISVDGRLHNETDDPHVFEVKAETDDGYDLVSDSFEVPGGGTETIPGIGVPGATHTFTIAVNETERSETLTLDIEPADHVVDGYVDIRYGTTGEIELSVTPRSESTDPDSVPNLSGYTVSDVAITPNVERESDQDSWGIFVASRSVAAEYFDIDDNRSGEVGGFVAETAFEDGERLVYVQAYAPQTCYELVLGDEPSIDANGLPVVDTELTRTKPIGEPCEDAITPVDLLVRLSFDPDGPPADVIVIQIADSAGTEQEGFQLEAEQ